MLRQKRGSTERRSGSSGSFRHSDLETRRSFRTEQATRSRGTEEEVSQDASRSATSDDDIDPELREGINNIMKYRDEYDKLEDALRQLGVDAHLEPRQHEQEHQTAVEADVHRLEQNDRHQLSVLREEDESSRSTTPVCASNWVQMALPGGGMVTVPLDPTSPPDTSSMASTVLPNTMDNSNDSNVTHFNVDHLIGLVQSFQLDTSLANAEDQEQKDLSRSLALIQPLEGEEAKANANSNVAPTTFQTTSPANDASGASTRPLSAANTCAQSTTRTRETHSCPSSPATDNTDGSSSEFSTLRRRSITLTEKVRTNKDGTKTQVVRQYGCNTESGSAPVDASLFKQNSYVYNNNTNGNLSNMQQSLPTLNSASSTIRPQTATTLPRRASPTASLATTVSSQQQQLVRLNSLEPNTVMFSTLDYPSLSSDITVPEIIDELEQQFEEWLLSDVQGVRLVASNVYICLSRGESVEHLTTYGFYVRGIPVKLIDVTHDAVVVCITGVPHYITDATVGMMVATFGVALGEVERRFYKGVDTGERLVRLKPRPRTQVPDFMTVGGCKMLIRVLAKEEVQEPFTLLKKQQAGNEGSHNAPNNHSRQKPSHHKNESNGNQRSSNGRTGTHQKESKEEELSRSAMSTVLPKPKSPTVSPTTSSTQMEKRRMEEEAGIPTLAPPDYNRLSDDNNSDSNNDKKAETNSNNRSTRRLLSFKKYTSNNNKSSSNNGSATERGPQNRTSTTVNGILRRSTTDNAAKKETNNETGGSRSSRKNKRSKTSTSTSATTSAVGTKSGPYRKKAGNKKGSNNNSQQPQKDLALTRDLPWCGCWGNGCL